MDGNYLDISEKFKMCGLSCVFSFDKNKTEASGNAEVINVMYPGKRELQAVISIKSLMSKKYPPFEEVKKMMPVLSGIMNNQKEKLKTFDYYLRSYGDDFWSKVKDKYGLRSELKSAYDELQDIVGMESVKKEISIIVKGIKKTELVYEDDYCLSPDRFLTVKNESFPNLPHLALVGSPGTGKTMVARMIGRIMREEGLLSSGHICECEAKDLIAGFVGQTAIKAGEVVQKAMGGVLFLDEAYSLIEGEGNSTFGKEALSVLVKAMSDYKGQFVMIFAGYERKVRQMLSNNAGVERRIKYIPMPDYSAEELAEIMRRCLKKSDLNIDEELYEGVDIFASNLLRDRGKFGGVNFGNAGEITRQVEEAQTCANKSGRDVLLKDDFENKYLFEGQDDDDDLDSLIGLNEVKEKIIVIARRIKIEKKSNPVCPGHFMFKGSPGTGKTVVAKQMAKLFYDNGVLASAKTIIYDANHLAISGHDTSKINEILHESLGGVLFIDEAYQLLILVEGRVY